MFPYLFSNNKFADDMKVKTEKSIIDYYNDIKRSNIPLEDIQFIMNSRATLKR